MESKTIFDEMVRLFAELEFSPQISPGADEIYVCAPLNNIYEKADMFIHFYSEYYTLDAYLPADTDQDAIQTELLKLLNLINYNSPFGCMSLDENGRICCRYSASYADVSAGTVRESVYLPCFTLNRFTPAIKAVCGGSSASEAFDAIFRE